MQIQREKLLDSLSLVKPGIAKNEIIEQSTHFLFKDNNIISYNDLITICQPFQVEINGSISSNELYKLLQKFTDKTIDINQKDNELLISGRKTQAGLSIEKEIKLDLNHIKDIDRWINLPENFTETLKFCLFSASRNMIKPEFACLYINGNEVLSCDNYRATRKDLSGKLRNKFLIEARVVEELIKYNPTKICLQESWIHFINKENTIFSCRVFEGEYPDITSYFNIEGEEVDLPKNLKESLDRTQVLISSEFEQDKFIDITIKDHYIICKGEGPIGWVKEKNRISYNKKPIEIKIHPMFFIEILNHCNTMIVGESSVLFKGEDFDHVICLSE